MPSGATHDAITFLLSVPAGAMAYAATFSLPLSLAAAAAFVFGGIMFGPDLDTKSNQYSRWGPLRLIWFPYRTVFTHRSRWSHGLLIGTLLRVVYFLGVVSVLMLAIALVIAAVSGNATPNSFEFLKGWGAAGKLLSLEIVIAVFAGMWAGAASHTFADVAITYIKTGRVSKWL